MTQLWRSIFCVLFFGYFFSASGNLLQERINAAKPGDTLHVQGGKWTGSLVIDKPISIIGHDDPVIHGNHEGNVISITADGAKIDGLVIRNSGSNLSDDNAGVHVTGNNVSITNNRIIDSLHGIYLKKADQGTVHGNSIIGKQTKWVPVSDVLKDSFSSDSGELCQVTLNVNQRGNGIHLWNSQGNVVEENVIQHTRDGIYFSFSNQTTVRNNRILNVRYGLHYMYSDDNRFEHNEFLKNAAGSALMYSQNLHVMNNRFHNNEGRRAYGMLLQSVDQSNFLNNDVEENTVGIYLENSQNNQFYSTRIKNNYVGIRLTTSSAGNVFSGNRIVRNLHPVEFDQDSRQNQWSENGNGNFWSGATSPDLNGDGIGEFPHRESDLLGKYRRKFPLAGLLSESPVLHLIRFVQQNVNLPGIPVIEDPHPNLRSDIK